MTRKEQWDTHRPYIESEGLDKLIDFAKDIAHQEDVFYNTRGDLTIQYPLEIADVVRLHKLIRERRPFTVMEFGVGYSTIIMADALEKNQRDWEALKEKPQIRNRFMFQLFTVDASQKWIARAKEILPTYLSGRVHFTHSRVKIGTFNNQLCHYYENLPNVIADFIYLDGPSATDVEGSINGLDFSHCPERTVMSGDLLLMESTFLPGTFIIIDGRTNNARFLERNFKRNYRRNHDPEADLTIFELLESRLGKYNLFGTDFY